MKTIKAADQTISDVWGKGKTGPGCYRQMTYTIPVPVEEGTLLHNAVTGELVLLDAAEAAQLSALPCEYAPWMDGLIRKRFLVKAKNDDEKTVDTLRKALSLSSRTNRITHYVILPTTHCNARCFYCFESGNKRHLHMTDETADRLVGFMAAHRGSQKIKINWFGGEPLVSVRQIDRISAALKARDIPFSAFMVSNGYLFDRALAERIKTDWNLTGVQITLDGTEQIYNRTKNYRDPCESPYQKVLRNIGLLLENDIRVSIRLNLGLHNVEDLTRLVDELGERFQGQKGLSVYSHLLFENCGFEPTHFDNEALSTLMEAESALTDRIASLFSGRRRTELPSLRFRHCMVDKDDWAVVLPSGHLTKCEHFTDSHYVGDIDTGITDIAEWDRIRERVRYPHCSGCPLYPKCIRVKTCDDDRPCTETLVQLELQETVRRIRFIYEASLRDDISTAETEDIPNC